MIDQISVQIRTPKFELYELVTLYWNSQEYHTKFMQRCKERYLAVTLLAEMIGYC